MVVEWVARRLPWVRFPSNKNQELTPILENVIINYQMKRKVNIMAKDKVKVAKTFIVQRTYEVIVQAIDRDDAISQASMFDPTPESMVGVKCGTPKQMKRTDVQ